jgi:hypothetical protein
MYPADYRADADYIFANDRKVYNQAGALVFDTSAGGEWNGLRSSSSSPVVWTFSGSSTIDGTFYLEGDAIISVNTGIPGNPAKITLISTGSIELSGNIIIAPKLPGLLLLAGKDIKINGNANQNFSDGVIYAREQIGINNAPRVRGTVVARDVANVSTMVMESYLSGDAQFTNSMMGSISGLLSWREIKN